MLIVTEASCEPLNPGWHWHHLRNAVCQGIWNGEFHRACPGPSITAWSIMSDPDARWCIIEGVEQELARHDGARVAIVHLRLGPLSGVVKDALLFSYSLACEDTPLANSVLEIENMPITIYCPACACEQPAASIRCLSCSRCGTPSCDVRRGCELEVYALELVDENATATG